MGNAYIIEVRSEAAGLERAVLFPILESVMPVKFDAALDRGRSVSGKIVIGTVASGADENASTQISSLIVPQFCASTTVSEVVNLKVQFSDGLDVPFPFRGRSLSVKAACEPKYITLCEGETVLAKTEQGIVWCVSGVGAVKHHRTAFGLPNIPVNGGLQDVLNGDRFVEMLPLLHFLRGVCEDDLYEAPPLRAQFMFDDPNLHWPSYGYVDYKELAVRAARENYHVSFATVPLDIWTTNNRAAEVFRNAPKLLSLCVHGNNHTKRELAQDCSQAERATLCEQAIHRISRLEQKTGLQVSRVMVPPHGACLHEMLEEMPRRGFESACISAGSLRAHNKTRPWTKQLGYHASELIGGCPVLPRWALANSDENTVLLAAFLRQAIVLRGHHQDLKGGIELLDGFARIVNRLGDVAWSNMSDISRLNYSWRMDGDTLKVKPLGRKLNVSVPEGASELLIESPMNSGWDSWRLVEANGSQFEILNGEKFPISTRKKHCVTIEVIAPKASFNGNDLGSLPITAFVRRILTEGRDRVFATIGR